jgi:putative transposase
MNLAHKIQLFPNVEQRIALAKAAGCSRFAYNWALAKWTEMYEAKKGNNTLPAPSALGLKKEFNKIKEVEFPWIYESPKDANQQAFTNLGTAFKRFFKKEAKHPKFKKKHNNDSFYVSNDKLSVDGFNVKVPVIGSVKMAEEIRFEGRILSATVSKDVDVWYISFSIDATNAEIERNHTNELVGVDLGLTTFAVLSTGEEFESPKPLRKNKAILARKQRSLSRRKMGSKRREKQKVKVAKLHRKIRRIRSDFINKTTSKICSENQTIVIEDLDIKKSMQDRKNAFGYSDAGLYEFRRQLIYKSKIYGNNILVANKWFPSTKTCNECGWIDHGMTLNDRTFKCQNPECNYTNDRDLNASLNLYTLGYSEIYARGHSASGTEQVPSWMVEARTGQAKITQSYTC